MSQVEGAIDPNVKMPAAVLAAANRATDIHKQAYSPEPANPPEPTDEPNPEETPVQEQAVEQPKDPAQEAAPPVTSESNKPIDWEHRFNSMKGRYDQAQRALQAQNERISQLEATIASMQAPPAPENRQRLLTPEDEETYGSEFIDVVRRAAREEANAEIDALQQKIQNLQAQLQGVNGYVTQDARSRLFSALDASISNWQEVNQNPEFHSWLALPDPYSGVIRQELLNAAFERNDSPRVLAFFNGFLAQEAAVDPAKGGPDKNTATPTPAKVPLAAFAAPGRAKTAAGMSPPAEKPTFTRAEITRFYTDVAAGRYAGKQEERLRLERQIHEAGIEGRIR